MPSVTTQRRNKNKGQRNALREEARKAQGGHCFYCDRSMNKIVGHPLQCTAEHLIEYGKGGPDARWNIVAACYECNQRRAVAEPGTEEAWVFEQLIIFRLATALHGVD